VRFSSNVLARLAAALGDKVAGRESLQLQDLQLPAVVSPIITVLAPYPTRVELVAPAMARDSFIYTASVIQAPSASTSVNTLGTFGRGAWRLLVGLASICDFTSIAGPFVNYIRWQDAVGGGANGVIIAHHAAVNVPQFNAVEHDLVLPVDGWLLQGVAGATAAAQNSQSSWFVHARRLL